MLGAILVIVLGYLLGAPKIETEMEKLLKDPVSIATVALLAVTLGPLIEEIFFRGLLQPVIAARAGAAAGILASALLFGTIHLPQYSWSWRHLLLVTTAGCIFGWRRHATGSTGAATITHASYNLTVFLGFLASR
jgi:membrane protease YdiL (CAAX protease family)